MIRNEKLLSMTQIAMLTALIAVLSQVALPMPSNVPLTLQTFAVSLCAYLGGMRKGISAVLVYLAVGAVGVPVFSAFRGGLGVMLGYTGGFLWGFLPLTVLCAWGTVLRNKTAAVFTGMIGMLLCHVSGVLQYAVITGSGIMQSVFLVSAPYILKDVVCVAAGYFAANAVQRALRAAGLKNE
ncbi:MAG: biotin transporter BioY [Ruminococcus sp.]|nr:biotin transporter BioY [Ruminococcus sp.]